MTSITLAVDAMGGDKGVRVVVPATVKVAKQKPELHFILVGDKPQIKKLLAKHHAAKMSNISINHTTEEVSMDESPATALRTKKNSSMRVAINLVKEGVAAACISAGNTGALMATARFVLKTLPGIDRPAIINPFPTLIPGKVVNMLDLGANVNSSSEHLVQFAVMGSVMTTARQGILHPKVALLNVGAEEIKGNDLVKATAAQLNELKGINFIGYVEGDDIYKGTADVVVCDGFVGNVTLKASEGLARLISQYIRRAFSRNLLAKIVGLFARYVLCDLKRRLDPAEYNGAVLIGLQGVVVKSHGDTNVKGFMNALALTAKLAVGNLPDKIHDQVEQLLESRQV